MLKHLIRKFHTVESVYKRVLPEHNVSFASPTGKLLFKQALSDGNMENYFRLAEQFTT